MDTQGKRAHLRCWAEKRLLSLRILAYPRSRATRYPTHRAPERRNVVTTMEGDPVTTLAMPAVLRN